MQHAYSQAHNGQRRVVFICGEPGIGKTRLSRDFTRWGEETQQATVLWGYCYELKEDERDPFIPVVSLSARIWWAFLADSSKQMLDYALRAADDCRTSHRFAWVPMMTYGAA